MDQSKKTMRHFYCRDVLWETFEQMANDFDCSIDYLINESMRYYARSKNYPAAGGPAPSASGQAPMSQPPSAPPRRPQPSTQPPPAATSSPGARRPAPPTPAGHVPSAAPGSGGGMAGPGMSGRPGPTGAMAHGAQSHGPGYGASPQPAMSPGAAPQMMPSSPPGAALAPGGSTLFLTFNGQRYPVAKDQFIIGRGSKTSDLAIKDGNISRKHAAVIRRNGTFYIKDLGSTNGIDYKGMRIDNKRIDEGDVFHLCDYELRFTYRQE